MLREVPTLADADKCRMLLRASPLCHAISFSSLHTCKHFKGATVSSILFAFAMRFEHRSIDCTAAYTASHHSSLQK